MTGRAWFRSEYLEVDFSATPELVDFGVPGSPRWIEYTDPRVEFVTILGVDVPFDSLPEALQQAIYELHTEVEFERDDA